MVPGALGVISSADEDSSDSLSDPVAKKRDIAEGRGQSVKTQSHLLRVICWKYVLHNVWNRRCLADLHEHISRKMSQSAAHKRAENGVLKETPGTASSFHLVAVAMELKRCRSTNDVVLASQH